MDATSPTAPKEAAGGIPIWVPVLVVWAVLRQIQVSVASGGFGNDVVEYFGYARAWVEGKAPYVDFQVEYPPGALLLFLLPLLVGGRERYVKSFITEMALFDLLTLLLVLGLAARISPGRRRAPIAAAAAYLLSTALLHPVLYARFDLASAALVAAAFWLLDDDRPVSPILLGLAAGVKFWPLGLAPLWLGRAYRRSGSQGLLRTAVWITLGYLAPALLLLPRVGARVLSFLEFHRDRGIQIESIWGTLALLLDRVGLGHAAPVFEFGAWDVQCRACPAFHALSIPLLLAAVL
ncbi:MAG: glycosyltransferase 87 family protein, partial [Myxococcaceae bacterium]